MFVCLFALWILAWLPYSSQECIYTHWSVWGECHAPPELAETAETLNIPQKCTETILQRVRTRGLLFFQESDSPCSHLTETQLCDAGRARACLSDSWEHYATPIDPFYWRAGPWGGCQLIGQSIGLQRRNVSCFDRNNSQSAVSLCPAPEPAVSRVCHISSPCQVSPWGKWSPCLTTSCDLTVGNRTRFRSVARQPTFGSCPSLWQREECSENVTCRTPDIFEWSVASDWSDCDVTGFSHRLVLCYRRSGKETFLSEQSNCPISRPLSHLSCSPHPVLGPWGDWDKCSESCPSIRVRRRQLITGVSSQLVEYALCDTCRLYTYSCHLYNDTSGRLYSHPCNYTLPSNVILSHWSDWSLCNPNTSTRTRDLMGYPAYQIPTNIPFRITQQRGCYGVTYSWRVSDWSDCGTYSGTEASCFQGYHTRDVECVDSNGHSSIYCEISDKPPSNRTCQSECVDSATCLYSNWSVYSECSSPCGFGTRTKNRIILRSADCPHPVGHIIHSEEQCIIQECPPSYHWEVKEFGDCIPLTQHGNCGPGYRTAGIQCLTDSGILVSEENCGSSPLPPSETLVSNCTLPCPSCAPSQWGPFSPCPSFCGSATRSRTREISGLPCPLLPASEFLSCPPVPCPSYRWAPVSRWSQCLPLDTCGRGMAHRAIACLRSDSVPFPDSFCPQASPPVLKECHTPCPAPCVPGPWTHWSPCSSSCDGGVRYRNRPVVTPAIVGGQECPSLFELAPCSPATCPAPLWIPGTWGPCVPTGLTCGFGTKERSVRCLIGTNSSTACPLFPRPVRSQVCYLHCPPDCIQTHWGHWSPCLAGTQNRTREVLRAREGAGVSCGSPLESRSCSPLDTEWSYSPYSPCSHPKRSCGTGTQYRNYSCVLSTGGHSPSHLCLAELGPPSPLSRLCNLSCPVPCGVSPFSDWSTCSGTCASPSGVQIRNRSVTDSPKNGGSLCPPLEQSRPCFLSSCPLPALHRGQWSSCQTHGRSCGSGEMVRSVLCLDKFGSPLPLSSCVPPLLDPFSPFVRLDLDMRIHAPCSVPCPDTVLLAGELPTRNCSSLCSHPARGLKITPHPLRYLLPGSRTPPGDLYPEYRSLPCVPSPDSCISLEWNTSEWTGPDREIWCEARGPLGVIPVSSGCDPGTRPSPSRAPCLPSCGNFSLCSDLSGRCECVPEFQLSGGRCVPFSGCRENIHCPPGHLCNTSQECVLIPSTSPTDRQLVQSPALIYYVTIGLVSLLILVCLVSTVLILCIAVKLCRNRPYSFIKPEEGPSVPPTPIPSVFSDPPAYSLKDLSERESSLLSPPQPIQSLLFGRSQSDPLLWSPLHVHQSFSAPLTPLPPPYLHIEEHTHTSYTN